MDLAKQLRRTIFKLAKQVETHNERISVKAMLQLSAQIKGSLAGLLCHKFYNLLFVIVTQLFQSYVVFLIQYLTSLQTCK